VSQSFWTQNHSAEKVKCGNTFSNILNIQNGLTATKKSQTEKSGWKTKLLNGQSMTNLMKQK
jgi:hypothetical protein